MKILKRSLCLIAAIAVFICSFALPSFADSLSSGGSDLFYSYWNITKMKVLYNDGSAAIFELPNTVYISNSYYDEDIVLTSSDGSKTLSMRCYSGTTLNPNPSLSYIFDILDFSSLVFYFEDAIIKPFTTVSRPVVSDNINLDPLVPLFQLSSDYDPIYNFDGSFISIRPVYEYGEDFTKFSFQEFSSGFSYVASSSIYNSYELVPFSVLDNEISYYSSSIEATIRRYKYPYFKSIYTSFDFNFSNFEGSSYSFGVSLPLGLSNGDVSFNSVSDWYSLFFKGYNLGQDVNFDFTSWISTAVGGFLSMELFPGFSLGTLLTFVIGVAAVNFFLKFFAGG